MMWKTSQQYSIRSFQTKNSIRLFLKVYIIDVKQILSSSDCWKKKCSIRKSPDMLLYTHREMKITVLASSHISSYSIIIIILDWESSSRAQIGALALLVRWCNEGNKYNPESYRKGEASRRYLSVDVKRNVLSY